MNPAYLHQLTILKSTFLSGNESQQLAASIIARVTTPSISLLDVGTGLGRGLVDLVDTLRTAGVEVHALALDPYIPPDVADTLRANRIDSTETAFEAFDTTTRFDVITVTQSIYYLRDQAASLNRLCELLADNGLLCVTLWSDKCIFRDIASATFNDPDSPPISASDIVALLSADPQISTVSASDVTGEVAVRRWLDSDDVLFAVASVLSRRSTPPSRLALERFKNVVNALGDIEIRCNRVILAVRGERPQC